MNLKTKHIVFLFMAMMMAITLPAQHSTSHRNAVKALPSVVAVDTTAIGYYDDEAAVQDSDSLLETPDTVTADTLRLPWPENVKVKLDQLTRSDMFETSQLGLMVWDLKADSMIYEHGSKQILRPASTMKLVTAITAIDRLGGSYRLKTQLKYTGQIADGVLNGDVYCVGGMDPRFNSDDLQAFVSSLKEMGVDTIRGRLLEDRSFKDTLMLGEGWCWDDKNPTLSPTLIGRKDKLMERFVDKLAAAGICLDSTEVGRGRCPQGAFTIVTRFHTIDQVLSKMMKESDNLYAEAMYYQLAASGGARPATARHARQLERQLIQRIGLSPSRYKLADGSGLSLYNYVSAELLVRLLRYAYNNDNVYFHLLSSLPIAGEDGTLKSRMRSPFTRGNVQAKTGTLTGIISLAGYLTAANGHRLCFAIINQGVMHASSARQFQDKVCEALCAP